MENYMKFFIIIACFFALPALAEEKFPARCQAVAVKDAALMLKTAKPPVLILLHNLANTELWITHPDANAASSSKLQSGHWSALTLQDKSFELNCVESRPGHEQQVPCAGVLGACTWNGVKIPEGEAGTYWAAENMLLAALKAHIGGRGFVLPIP
jgi:hypothetical protein